MHSVEHYYQDNLLKHGFSEIPSCNNYCPIGKLFKVPEKQGHGLYWVYGEKNLYDIKIHDFYYHEDSFVSLETPECLSITYYDSIAGEELTPYRRLTAGCVKAFIGGYKPYWAIFHKYIPIRCIGIEIMPAYYERYLKTAYPNEYIDPHDAFCTVDQTHHFPEMIKLLRQVWSYQGDGIAAKLFFESKVAEAISLTFEYGKHQKSKYVAQLSNQDMKSLENVTAYINDHFNCDISLEHLSKISCMGATKLRSSFKQVYECTISEYIQQRRFSHAEILLASTNFTIEQIASSVGYCNAGRFAHSFKKNTGLFPAEYRKMSQRKKR